MEQPHNLSISAHDAFQAVTKYWGRINRPEQVMTDMISAMRVLTDTANTGAVAISLPQDVQAEAYDYPVDFFQKRVWRIERRPATKYAIDKAVEAIKNAKKPLLICGGGVRYAEAHKVFKKFAEDFGIAFGETQACLLYTSAYTPARSGSSPSGRGWRTSPGPHGPWTARTSRGLPSGGSWDRSSSHRRTAQPAHR